MGVKSTIFMSRASAEERAYNIIARYREDEIRSYISKLSDSELEDFLEAENDRQYESGSGFDNYLITVN